MKSTIQCADCPKKFKSSRPDNIRCIACRRKRKLKMMREYDKQVVNPNLLNQLPPAKYRSNYANHDIKKILRVHGENESVVMAVTETDKTT